MSDERDRPDSIDDARDDVTLRDERAAEKLNTVEPTARGRIEAERVAAERRRRTVVIAVAAVAVIAIVAGVLIWRSRKSSTAAEETEAAVVSVKVA